MPQTPNSKPKKASSGTAKRAGGSKKPTASSAPKSSPSKKTSIAAKASTAPKRKTATTKIAGTKTAVATATTAAKTKVATPAKKSQSAGTRQSKATASKKSQSQKSNWVSKVRSNIESRGDNVKKFNMKLIDIAHKDTDQFFDMSRAVVRARSWPEVVEIQTQYVSDRINCYRAGETIDDNPKATVSVFAWIAKQAGVTLGNGKSASTT